MNRRDFFRNTGAATLAAALPVATLAQEPAPAGERRHPKVRTPNGWTLPYQTVDGVKVFHLVAEEIEHEFAPGTRAKCWGYNGSTPGPTIEVDEGDRVRIYVTNRLPEHTTIHWHGIDLPSGMDGVGGLWRTEVTEIVGVGQTRDLEFIAQAGDWAFHCHKSHHTMNAMGHEVPNTLGVDQSGIETEIRKMLPGYMAMGEHGMAEHQDHTDMGHMPGPENTLPMMMGKGPYGNLEMGGMFTVIKVRDDLAPGDYRDPGWYRHPPGTVAQCISRDPDFGNPVRRAPLPPATAPVSTAKPGGHEHH